MSGLYEEQHDSELLLSFFFFLIKIILYFDRDYHLVFVDVTVNVYSVIIWQAFVIRQTPWYILECNGV